MKTVITYGTFDLLHTGHVNLLKRARALGDRLIVGVILGTPDLQRMSIGVLIVIPQEEGVFRLQPQFGVGADPGLTNPRLGRVEQSAGLHRRRRQADAFKQRLERGRGIGPGRAGDRCRHRDHGAANRETRPTKF